VTRHLLVCHGRPSQRVVEAALIEIEPGEVIRCDGGALETRERLLVLRLGAIRRHEDETTSSAAVSRTGRLTV